MSPEEFRRAGRAVVDWIAEYLQRVENLPVLSRVQPGDVRAQLPAHPPRTGEPFAEVLADVERVILPGLTHWQSPNFFAYFPSNASGPAILGELLSAGLGVQGMLWATSPACTELETHVLDWFVEILGLPARMRSDGTGGGVIQDTASSAVLCAVVAARERASGFASDARGVDRRFVGYVSDQAHSSVEKAFAVAGVGREHLRRIGVDASYALRPELLEAAIQRDLEQGATPFFACATLGTTSSTAVDPLPEVAAICARHGLWLHVDAAYGGSAAVCPEFAWLHAGVEGADSYCFNPHKWLLTNFDCDCLWVADRAGLVRALSVLPEYLRNQASASGAVLDYRDWQIPLGRRFRALKLWFVLRHYGVEGLQRHVRAHVHLARQFAEWVRADEHFELAAPVPLALVCFRHRGDDAFNEALLAALNDSGRVYLTHTRLGGRFVLRMAIGAVSTQERHVRAAWEQVVETAQRLRAEHSATPR